MVNRKVYITPRYVNHIMSTILRRALVKFFQAAAKLENSGSCAQELRKLHNKSHSWQLNIVKFSNVKTLDKFKNL